jgi:hypothetical protein
MNAAQLRALDKFREQYGFTQEEWDDELCALVYSYDGDDETFKIAIGDEIQVYTGVWETVTTLKEITTKYFQS